MVFILVFKSGLKTIARIEGKNRTEKDLTMNEISKVIELENYVEKLTGLRLHVEFKNAKKISTR